MQDSLEDQQDRTSILESSIINQYPELSDSYLREEHEQINLKGELKKHDWLPREDEQNKMQDWEMSSICSLESEGSHQSFNNESQTLKSIGMLAVYWKDEGYIKIVKYGTAFLLNQSFILTCAHNVHLQPFHDEASEIMFIPGVEGSLESAKKYRNMKGKFYRCIKLVQYLETYDLVPLRNELCLIVLSRSVRLKSYCKIGIISMSENQPLEIIGYPSEQNRRKIDLSSLKAKRIHLKGRAISSEGCILNHNLQTDVGFSGSPILTTDKQGRSVVVGIHTHRGEGSINRGLFFTEEIIKDLQLFESDLKKSYKLSIFIQYVNEDKNVKGCSLISQRPSLINLNPFKNVITLAKPKILRPSQFRRNTQEQIQRQPKNEYILNFIEEINSQSAKELRYFQEFDQEQDELEQAGNQSQISLIFEKEEAESNQSLLFEKDSDSAPRQQPFQSSFFDEDCLDQQKCSQILFKKLEQRRSQDQENKDYIVIREDQPPYP